MKNTKAKMRSGQADCVSNLKADTSKQSNQIRMGGAPAGHPLPTGMKNASKRKLGLKLPANF